MKKLKAKNLELKADEILSRDQLKSIFGGVEGDQECIGDLDCGSKWLTCGSGEIVEMRGHCVWLTTKGVCRWAGCPY